ncbi:MAG: hypothetical protein GWP08_05030 [Nitrospiraceae bacterium]|nr:hypothetical protein [Nitrospiraceae bacterium]
MKHLTTLPSKAVTLPNWPEDHDADFLEENAPDNLIDAIGLIIKHIKAIFG